MKTKIEIIDETVEMIKEKGRALDPNSGSCLYLMPEETEHPGCAVGRCMIPSKYESFMEGEPVDSLVRELRKRGESLDEILAPEYRGHEITFWTNLQHLHDNREYWMLDSNKLSPEGEREVERMRQIYAN